MGHPALDLTGRVAVVIGGTSGIGRALSIALAQAGADIVPTGRRADLIDEVAQEVEATGCRALRIPSDIVDESSLQALLDATVRAWDKVDILVNCAGITKRVPTLEMRDDDWDAIMATNVTGALRASRVFGRHMIERRYGRIIHIASLSSFVALYEVAAYAASKAAVASLTKSLAIEWAAYNVCVNAIAPGVFRTALNSDLLDRTDRGHEFLLRTPMKRFGRVEELAGVAVFLASEAASYVTGEVVVVDGGFLASGVNQ